MLSAQPVIDVLQRDFVNAWVLAKDLDALAARGDADLAALCKVVKANYGYPVDSVVVGGDLQVHGHVNVHEPAGFDADLYLAFLRRGLTELGRPMSATTDATATTAATAARARPEPSTLVVTAERPNTSRLDSFRALGFGKLSMAFHAIDTTAFADGGVLELQIRVGSGTAAGRFELCAPVTGPAAAKGEPPATFMQPVRTVDIAREATQKIEHVFQKGEVFGLAVKPGPDCAEGDTNAFLVEITVRKR